MTAKKINKNVALNKINPNKDEAAINNGNDIKLTLFSLINFAFALFRKNGHVAAKCVSAKNKIVKNYVELFGGDEGSLRIFKTFISKVQAIFYLIYF